MGKCISPGADFPFKVWPYSIYFPRHILIHLTPVQLKSEYPLGLSGTQAIKDPLFQGQLGGSIHQVSAYSSDHDPRV